MKRLKQLAFFLLLGSVAFTSCKGDDPVVTEDMRPTITVVPSKSAAAPGESVQFKITVAANNKDLKTLTIKQSTNGNTAGQIMDTTFSNRTSATLNYDYLVSGNNGDKNTFTFTITDKDNVSNSTEQTITVSGTSNLQVCSNVVLGSYNNTTRGSSFNSENCTVWKAADARTNAVDVDFVYFYGSTNGATLAAPNDASFGTGNNQIDFGVHEWNPRNATLLKKLSNFDFSAATATTIEAAVGSGGDSKANNLAVGDIIGFLTAEGTRGVARVKEINGGAAGTILLDVKTTK